MIYDSHIHLGAFANGLYFSAEEIAEWSKKEKIDGFLFFQPARTSSFTKAYGEFLDDISALYELCNHKAYPALWLPLTEFKNIDKYFFEDISAIKFHPKIESNLSDSDFKYVMDIVAEADRPLIIHSSYDSDCSCMRIASVCERCPKSTVVIAHCRPFEYVSQALSLPNVYGDTAYMPIIEVQKLVANGYGEKLLFGSDFPIDRYFFPEDNPLVRYDDFKRKMSSILPEVALEGNFKKLFIHNLH
jgi:amidohydrolase